VLRAGREGREKTHVEPECVVEGVELLSLYLPLERVAVEVRVELGEGVGVREGVAEGGAVS